MFQTWILSCDLRSLFIAPVTLIRNPEEAFGLKTTALKPYVHSNCMPSIKLNCSESNYSTKSLYIYKHSSWILILPYTSEILVMQYRYSTNCASIRICQRFFMSCNRRLGNKEKIRSMARFWHRYDSRGERGEMASWEKWPTTLILKCNEGIFSLNTSKEHCFGGK